MGATDRAVHVIVNPTKFDGDTTGVRAEIEAMVAAFHGSPPVWAETTEDDPGHGQTRAALEAGAGVVCALGGDGTVRAVAQELARAESDVPLGLLPGGTGNLLARNLDVPHADLAEAVKVAWTGEERRIDIGWLTIDGGDREAFVVMAGVGFDAAVMDDAPEGLKARVGWAAYVVAAARNLRGEPFSVTVTVDDVAQEHEARMVVVGNCGALQGGIDLAPDAQIDDGVLDAVVLTPSSMAQWAAVAKDVALKKADDESDVVCRARGRRVDVTVAPPQLVEVDGDVLGEGSHLVIEVQPLALSVKVP